MKTEVEINGSADMLSKVHLWGKNDGGEYVKQ